MRVLGRCLWGQYIVLVEPGFAFALPLGSTKVRISQLVFLLLEKRTRTQTHAHTHENNHTHTCGSRMHKYLPRYIHTHTHRERERERENLTHTLAADLSKYLAECSAGGAGSTAEVTADGKRCRVMWDNGNHG